MAGAACKAGACKQLVLVEEHHNSVAHQKVKHTIENSTKNTLTKQIGPDGAVALAGALKANAVLSSLNLAGTSIGAPRPAVRALCCPVRALRAETAGEVPETRHGRGPQNSTAARTP